MSSVDLVINHILSILDKTSLNVQRFRLPQEVLKKKSFEFSNKLNASINPLGFKANQIDDLYIVEIYKDK